jgi:predicted RNA-binding protein YlxR (DUF448 family)
MKNKREMIRVVRSDENVFSLDFTGKRPGRGAYVCPNRACLERAYKQKGLERSFKHAVPPEVYEQLKEELEKREPPSTDL